MKRFFLLGLVAICVGGRAEAQTSLEVLEGDLKEAREQHDAAASQSMSSFLDTLQKASESADDALDLYKNAGGTLPAPTKVVTRYNYETLSEKEHRKALDAAALQALAVGVQIHCGLMRNAALIAVTPKAPGVQNQWLDWLKATATIYPQIADSKTLKDVAMSDSIISKYLGFHGWGDSDSGKWTVAMLPELYRTLVLAPLRHPPRAGVIDAWNTYISMRHADEPGNSQWAQDGPSLEFDRDADDFALQPTMDKLQALDELIKANPTDDHLNDWVQRMQGMIDIYRHGGAPTPGLLPGATPGTPSSGSTGTLPAATPGTPSSGSTGVLPAATPGTPP